MTPSKQDCSLSCLNNYKASMFGIGIGFGATWCRNLNWLKQTIVPSGGNNRSQKLDLRKRPFEIFIRLHIIGKSGVAGHEQDTRGKR
jgi:hypothetical protein